MKQVSLVLMFLLLLLGFCATGAQAQCQYNRLPDGAYVEINERVVSEESCYSVYDPYDFFWVEMPNRSSGVRVESQGYAYEGDLVDVWGQMETAEDGSRMIIIGGGNTVDYGYPLPRPLGLSPEMLKFGPKEDLIRTWGTVTAVDSAAYPVSNSYTIAGIAKVYDNMVVPAVGDFKVATGTLTHETDSAGNKSYVIYGAYPGYDTNNPRGPGTYSLSGEIFVDYFAEGQTVNIETDSGQTSCVLDWLGRGKYSMTLPAGYYAISAEIPGYSTCTTFADLSSSNTEANFGWFSPLEIGVLVPVMKRVSVGGTTNLSGWCYDTEARGMAGIGVPWSTSDSQSGHALTDSEGNFSITLNTSDRKVITVDFGGVGSSFVQVAAPTDPTLIIKKPLNGDNLTGFVTLSIDYSDTQSVGCGNTVTRQMLVDSKPFCSFFGDEEEARTTINTAQLSNGQHTFTAVATSDEGIITKSNDVIVNVSNDFSGVTMSSTELFTDDSAENTITFSAMANQAWSITITKVGTGYSYATASGSSAGPVSFSWNGKDSNGYQAPNGIYKIALWYPGQTNWGQDTAMWNEQYCAVSQKHASGHMLAMGKVINETPELRNNVFEELEAVADACTARGMSCTLLLDPFWNTPDIGDPGYPKMGMKWWLGVMRPKNLFFATHGGNIECEDGKWRTFFEFADGISVGYTNDWIPKMVISPVTGKPFTRTQEQIDTTNPAFTQYLGSWPMNIVQIQACFSAGSWMPGRGYETEEWRKAFMFDPALGCGVFLGWSGGYRPLAVPFLWALSPNGYALTCGIWRYLGYGYTVLQAISYQEGSFNPTDWGWMSFFLVDDPDENAITTWLE